MLVRHGSALFIFLLAVTAIASCAQEEYPASLWNAQHAQDTHADVDATAPGPRTCAQAQATPLPQRLVAMSASAGSGGTVVLVSDLFDRFNSVCGSCHGPAVDPPGNGGFQIQTSTDFSKLMTAAVLAHVTSTVACPYTPDPTNPVDPMPPCSSPNGMLYSQRPETDPVRQFAELIQTWLAAGSPLSFTPPSTSSPSTTSASPDAGASALTLTPAVGTEMTNLGSCIPSAALFATETTKSAALDAMFAGLSAAPSGSAAEMIGLPEHLDQTDLFTLDTEALAPYGVAAYAPAYPLWSDNAGKMRYVRVPRGTSIHFDKASQTFAIPPNTRFYKTFMKEIVDTDGSFRWRKMETRLIVSRPAVANSDGTFTQTAIFGTYRWSDDESDAVLVETPLKSGRPFADTVFLYDTDEPLAAAILKGAPAAPEEALLEAQAARHYAIPSSDRCGQCHMGSQTQSFVLGFIPLQIARRPVGVGGVIEPMGPDELTQLQRLIDLGVLSGIDSVTDVLPLEQSEGSRTPRNDYELTAQGYVLGNCSHCHNPNGLPTVQNPVLKGVLDMLPSATGGLFQFPLERYSPRIGRGLSGSTPIPYITPSLVDLPRLDPSSGNQAADVFTQGTGPDDAFWVIYAPWRSLIYRNADNAFAYTDDLALYPHMPMNTPGYDDRAKQILSDWMVSIPAVRKHPEIVEYAYQTDGASAHNIGSPVVDSTPQPYVELRPGDPGYDDAVAAAQQRLGVLHTGLNSAITLGAGGTTFSRYADPGQTDDILDPAVLADPVCSPIPSGDRTLNTYPFAEHPHWVNTDLSQPPGPWAPRQTNWTDVLVEQNIPPASRGCSSPAGAAAAYADQVLAVGLLQSATLDQVRSYVTTPIPFGLWQVQSGCDFSSVPTAGSFTGTQRPHWMDVSNAPADAPVYSESPGAAVFKMICINCHGPKADSNGRLAQNLATMTGGLAEVADFRDGLFGPVGSTEIASNRHLVFGTLPADATAAWTSVTDDDRAARYMGWMALGGTPVQIPIQILEIVAVTHVLDQQRVLEASSLSANMLSQAKALCLGLLGPGYHDSLYAPSFDPRVGHGYLDANLDHLNDTLIFENGDAELWMRMCTTANPPPVHVLRPDSQGLLELDVQSIQDSNYDLAIDTYAPGTIVAAASYPPGVAVGDGLGGTDATLDDTNVWPWCVDDTAATSAQAAWIANNGLPTCPASVKSASHACAAQQQGAVCFGNDDANQWAVRGAINAGMSVFLYVQSLETTAPAPDYDQCSLLE